MPPAKDVSVGKCIVPTCTSHKSKITTHRVPKDPAKAEVWLKSINNPGLEGIDPNVLNQYYVVCKLHFSPDSYVPQTAKATLRPGAVPSLLLPPREEEEEEQVREPELELQGIPNLRKVTPLNISDFPSSRTLSRNIDQTDSLINNALTNVAQNPLASTEVKAMKRKQSRLLRFVSSQNHLTPKARHLYRQATKFKKKAEIYRRRNVSFMERLIAATDYSQKNNHKSLFDKLTPKQIMLMQLQLRVGNKNVRGRRFTVEEKALALALYKSSGRGYRVWKSIFPLPSTRTLLEMLSRLNLDTGLNRILLKCMKETVSRLTNPQDKLVTLVWDEMKLEPSLKYDVKADKIVGFEDWGSRRTSKFADHALVFMIHGVRRNWKMPISFSFCAAQTKSQQLAVLIKSHVAALKKVAFTIVATICDQAGPNAAAINHLKAMTRRELIKSGETENLNRMIISKMEIIPIFDVPHLLKCTRNNLLDKLLEFKALIDDDNRHFANWDHLELLYYLDMCLDTELRGLWKISQYHVLRKSIKKLKVKYAAQVFSRTFAANLATAAHHGCTTSRGRKMPLEATDTSRMLLFFNDLFDSLNGRAGDKSKTKWRRPVSATSGHTRFWIEARRRIQKMNFVNRASLLPSRRVPCLSNWSITLTGFIELCDRLLVKEGLDYFSPRNVNQDCLENFFGSVRAHGCRNVNPSCWQFVGTYKSLLVSNLNSHHSLSANCEDDKGNMLLNLSHMLEDRRDNHDEPVDFVDDAPLPLDANNNERQVPQSILTKTACSYTAGYVARRLLKSVQSCSECRSTILATEPQPDLHGELESREFDEDVHALMYVSENFIASFKKFDSILRRLLQSICFRRNLCKNLKAKLAEENCLGWLGCSVHASKVQSNFLDFTISLNFHTFCTTVNKILSGKEVRYSNSTNKIFKQAQAYRAKYHK